MIMLYWCKYRIKLLVKDLISFICFIFLKISVRLLRDYRKSGIRILLYHSIKDTPKIKDPLRITVPLRLFESQISYLLSSGYKILSITEVLDYLCGNKPITGREIALTFDDGFEDNFDVAFNILKKNGITAAYFLTCNYLESLCGERISWEKASKLISINITIGSHAINHINLGEISQNKEKLFEEIIVSKRLLQEKLKIPIEYFAYPFGSWGSYNSITEELLREGGYKAAFTNVFGSNKKGDNIFELKRTRITWDDTLFKFKMKLEGAYDWADWLVRA